MITYIQGDIFESAAQALVCPVNTVGVMGNGLALVFRERFPGLLDAYRVACRKGVFKQKHFFVYACEDGRKIVCLPTKRHWRHPSKIEWVDLALMMLARNYADYGIMSLAIPAVGCGKGQLEWGEVLPLIEEHFGLLDLPVEVYPPWN